MSVSGNLGRVLCSGPVRSSITWVMFLIRACQRTCIMEHVMFTACYTLYNLGIFFIQGLSRIKLLRLFSCLGDISVTRLWSYSLFRACQRLYNLGYVIVQGLSEATLLESYTQGLTERCYITWIMFFVQGLSEVTYIGLFSCSGAVICLINEN